MKGENICLSIIERVDCTLRVYLLRLFLIFTQFSSTSLQSNRSVASRFALYKLLKLMGEPSDYNYCFSHSGKLSAILVASSTDKIVIDIERSDRKLSKPLKEKIRKLYGNTSVSELGIIMIFECLIKLSVIPSPFSLGNQAYGHSGVKIVSIDGNIFEVTLKNVKVFSRFYKFNNLLVCITRDRNQLPISLNV